MFIITMEIVMWVFENIQKWEDIEEHRKETDGIWRGEGKYVIKSDNGNWLITKNLNKSL